MWKKATIGGLAAAAIVGTAGFAVAQTSSTTPTAATAASTPTPSGAASTGATTSKAKADKGGDHALGRQLIGKLKDFEHGEWVTKGTGSAANTTVTRDAILGAVTAVNGTSITVKADDGTSMTFAVDAQTKVRQRAKGQGTNGTIGDVKVGQKALVSGMTSPALTATLVMSRA